MSSTVITPPRVARAGLLLCAALVAAACGTRDTSLVPTSPTYSIGNPVNTGANNPFTLAVIGDTPYGPAKFAELPSLVALINSDPKVDLVAHLGDLKSGKNGPCSNEYFSSVKDVLDGLKDPFVYTPGDNEWTDCHVAKKNNGLYTPTERLQFIRSLFFPVAGETLGGRKKQVLTQADDPANSDYVENVMWMQSQVVFVTLNVTGSNDDLVPWGLPLPADAGNYPSQAAERVARTKANAAWLDKAFALAADNDAQGVVVMMQADMWDTLEPSLSGFDGYVQQLGTRAISFARPVLLLEGDSHIYKTDNPFSANDPLHAVHASTPVAENVTRIVVEGSSGRTEYLRLTVDPKTKGGALFRWERVPLQ